MTPSLFDLPPDTVSSPVYKTPKKTRAELVADLFRSRPRAWIDGLEISHVGGAYAWRTRVSECRKVFGMQIDNREVRSSLTGAVRSEYRYVPSERGE